MMLHLYQIQRMTYRDFILMCRMMDGNIFRDFNDINSKKCNYSLMKLSNILSGFIKNILRCENGV